MTHLTLHEEIYKTRIEYQKIKAERDNCLKDIEQLRERNRELERENGQQLALLKKFSGFINFKLWVSPASDTYKHYRSELDNLGVK